MLTYLYYKKIKKYIFEVEETDNMRYENKTIEMNK